MTLTENWKIFFASALVAFIVLFITLGWPYLVEKFSNKPDTCIFLFGYEKPSINLDNGIPNNLTVSVTPIKFPEGKEDSVQDVNIPIMPKQLWTLPNNERIYTLVIENKGEETAKNVKIDIDFSPSSIVSLNISNEERLSRITGGVGGTRLVLNADELLPGEIQAMDMIMEGGYFKSIEAWSETEGTLKSIYIVKISSSQNSTGIVSGTVPMLDKHYDNLFEEVA
jgi:hypothetical protein